MNKKKLVIAVIVALMMSLSVGIAATYTHTHWRNGPYYELENNKGTSVPVRGVYGCGKDCLILIPFRLPQISCFTLSLKCFSSDSDNCPDVGIVSLLQSRHPLRAGPVLLTLLFFPQFLHPTEFCVGLYILFCRSGTPVCSQLVFCMHFCV